MQLFTVQCHSYIFYIVFPWESNARYWFSWSKLLSVRMNSNHKEPDVAKAVFMREKCSFGLQYLFWLSAWLFRFIPLMAGGSGQTHWYKRVVELLLHRSKKKISKFEHHEKLFLKRNPESIVAVRIKIFPVALAEITKTSWFIFSKCCWGFRGYYFLVGEWSVRTWDLHSVKRLFNL